MLDPRALLEQFIGSGGNRGGASGNWNSPSQGFGAGGSMGGLGKMGGPIAMGGLLSLLTAGRRRGSGGGMLGVGSAALLGTLALRAYQNYHQGKPARVSAAPPEATSQPGPLPHDEPSLDGKPFELLLMRAIIGAIKADGHIDSAEQQRLVTQIEQQHLDPEAKAFVLDLLTKPVDLAEMAALVGKDTQRAEVYLAARMATDIDEPAEKAYLDQLANVLQLPPELRAHLDQPLAT
jgi:uncharacterized membrane protein YebE (DUF533 family)